MKKWYVLLALLLCLVLMLPLTASAGAYKISGTDMTVNPDETLWHVFTYDNLENHPDYEKLGLTKAQMEGILKDNEVELYAFVFTEEGVGVELFLKKHPEEQDIVNLANYKEKKIVEMTKEATEEDVVVDKYSVFEVAPYKYAKAEIKAEEDGQTAYLHEYITVINKKLYSLKFQSYEPFTETDQQQVEEFLKSVTFDVDPSLKEKNPFLSQIIGGVAGVAAAAGIGALITRFQKKKKESEDAFGMIPPQNPTNLPTPPAQ